MPEHKEDESSQNAQEQTGGKQQPGAESNTPRDNKAAQQPQKNQNAVAPDKTEDERTGDGTGARAGEYS